MAEHVVGPEDAGRRLDVFLADRVGSRSAAQRLIDGGRVTVDGRTRLKRHVVSAGERVGVAAVADEPARDTPPVPFDVVHEDADVLVVDKPAGVVVHPAGGHATGTLVQALRGRVAGGDDPSRPGVVHRLDRDTSGLMVLSRSERAHATLKSALMRREVVREYLALVEGLPPARSGTIDAPLGRDRRMRTRMSTDTDDPRDAVTHFEIAEALGRLTLLRVRLETGRTHQIRAHLKAIGHPVAGDPEYGTPRSHGLRRQFLHAQRLEFAHPVTAAPLSFTSELPDDLAQALEVLRSREP